MSKFSIDYQGLSNSVDKKSYKLSEVKDRIEKVAFDLVRFKEGNSDELWQIQDDYIVARYDIDDSEIKATSSDIPAWDVVIASEDISIFYKNHPITKIAASKFGFDPNDLNAVKKFLPNKLASDKTFVKALFNTLEVKTKENLFKLYPELL